MLMVSQHFDIVHRCLPSRAQMPWGLSFVMIVLERTSPWLICPLLLCLISLWPCFLVLLLCYNHIVRSCSVVSFGQGFLLLMVA
jgi:hypothetical protein